MGETVSNQRPWIFESTIDYEYGVNTKIRVWRNEPELRASYDNNDLLDLIHSCRRQRADASQAAAMLGAADRVAAVQVIYQSRLASLPDEGFVIYTDWP